MTFSIRRYQQGDAASLWQLLHLTVQRINCHDYTPEQLNAWAPEDCDLEAWHRRLIKSQTLVATAKGQQVGFATLESCGHIDCFYCAYDYQGQGVGAALLAALEQTARSQKIRQLTADVSLTAVSFFLHKGFIKHSPQQVTRQGVTLHNVKMSKLLIS